MGLSAGISCRELPVLTFSTTLLASEKDVDLAVKSSRKAFETVWGLHAKPTWRGQLLWRLADLMERVCVCT